MLIFWYDPTAIVDDNSCIPTVLGCIDSSAINFDSIANTDDAAVFIVILPISSCLQIDNICDGWVLVQATSSYPPIQYVWDNGYNGTFNDSLCVGAYTVSIADAQGCSIIPQ